MTFNIFGFIVGDPAGHFMLSAPTAFPPEACSGLTDFPPDTRIVLGVLLDPAQPEQVAPFTLIEWPTEGGTAWHAAVTQPPLIQQGRLPEEAGGTLDREDEGNLPRPTQLLGLDELRPLPPELPQPFKLDR